MCHTRNETRTEPTPTAWRQEETPSSTPKSPNTTKTTTTSTTTSDRPYRITGPLTATPQECAFVRAVFGLPKRKPSYADMAPWFEVRRLMVPLTVRDVLRIRGVMDGSPAATLEPKAAYAVDSWIIGAESAMWSVREASDAAKESMSEAVESAFASLGVFPTATAVRMSKLFRQFFRLYAGLPFMIKPPYAFKDA